MAAGSIVSSDDGFTHLDSSASHADEIRTVYPTLTVIEYRPSGHLLRVMDKGVLALTFAMVALVFNLIPSWEWWELLAFAPAAYNIYGTMKAWNEFKRGKDLRTDPQSFTLRTSVAWTGLIKQLSWLTEDQTTAQLLLWAHLNSGAEHTHGTLYMYFRDVQGTYDQKAAEKAAKEIKSNFDPRS